MVRCLEEICELSNIWMSSIGNLFLNSGDWILKEPILTWTELKEKFGIIVGEEKEVEDLNKIDRITIKIQDKQYEVLERLEKLGYKWNNSYARPTNCSYKTNYIHMYKKRMAITNGDSSFDVDYIISEDCFLENFKVEEKKVEKFKVGYRVEIINGNEILIGRTGTVIGIIEKQAEIELDDKGAWMYNPCMYFYNIKKIECESQAEPFELKEGMSVKLLFDKRLAEYYQGIVAIVTSIKGHSFEDIYGRRINFEFIDWEATRKLNGFKEEPKQEHYLVCNLKATSPKKIHNSLEEAKKEAERLAKLNIGQEFNVVKIVGKVKAEASVKWEGEK